jgi:hypothetical protein
MKVKTTPRAARLTPRNVGAIPPRAAPAGRFSALAKGAKYVYNNGVTDPSPKGDGFCVRG